ncbi:MAG: FAD-dependent oxidoreductase [Planctomycetaceae bacterium]|jgi:hypothetical protein|nr:FAD-dependent oxidoreductase [Planctomycetaceae bacterium]
MSRRLLFFVLFLLFVFASFLNAAERTEYLLEAEHFADYGGWVHDSQFMDQMGSPFLLAHGLGEPVKDAETEIELPPGTYNIFVRTRDWCAPWTKREPTTVLPVAPGQFQVLINGKPLQAMFGTESAEWFWQSGGSANIGANKTKVSLHDLTGFDGRCDAIYFVNGERKMENGELERRVKVLRKEHSQLSIVNSQFDVVVAGGGIAGICAAVSAARSGLTVALIQDRPVLGGNNSSEVRVWLQGARNVQPLSSIGNVVAELEQETAAHYGPTNTAEIYEDEKKTALVKAEKNITLFLEHRVNNVVKNENKITAVFAEQTKTGKSYQFNGSYFVDATGDGCLAYLAGADTEMTVDDGHMGRCNLWNVVDTGKPAAFPCCPWAVDLSQKDFPGRKNKNPLQLGGWYWESGFYLDPFEKSEYIRDLNFRAAYGAWDALKNTDKVFENYKMNWLAHIAGKRESRRIMGDVVLSKQDVIQNESFEDAAVPTGWPIDLHLPEPRYEKSFEGKGDEFISIAHYTKFQGPFWIPYRCLYSRNVGNLFMAGRDISVSHDALGTTRVMRTGGCMGEVVGLAASLCKQRNCSPRDVYAKHLPEFKELLKKGVPHSPEFLQRNPLAAELVPSKNNIANKAVLAVSSNPETAAFLNDGRMDLNVNESRWISEEAGKHEIVLQWKEPVNVNTLRIVSGYTMSGKTIAPVSDFVLQKKENGQWVDILRSDVAGNTKIDYRKEFPSTAADSLRLLITGTRGGIARIWEVEVF